MLSQMNKNEQTVVGFQNTQDEEKLLNAIKRKTDYLQSIETRFLISNTRIKNIVTQVHQSS